jgi:hypothetical protein
MKCPITQSSPHIYDCTRIKSAIIFVTFRTIWHRTADSFFPPKKCSCWQQKAILSWSEILAKLLHMSNLVLVYHVLFWKGTGFETRMWLVPCALRQAFESVKVHASQIINSIHNNVHSYINTITHFCSINNLFHIFMLWWSRHMKQKDIHWE